MHHGSTKWARMTGPPTQVTTDGRSASALAVGGGAMRVRRVVLKLSGEVFGGGRIGLDPDVVVSLARQVAAVVKSTSQRSEVGAWRRTPRPRLVAT